MKLAPVFLASALMCTLVSPAIAQVNYHFFPDRPEHVFLHHVDGTLISYASGNDTGGLAIRRSDGKQMESFLTFPNKINGKSFNIYSCGGNPGECVPPSIRLGKTHVRVTYWFQNAPLHERVTVSDSIVVQK